MVDLPALSERIRARILRLLLEFTCSSKEMEPTGFGGSYKFSGIAL